MIGNYTLSVTCLGACLLPAPTISSISPATILAGSGGFILTVNGANFVEMDFFEGDVVDGGFGFTEGALWVPCGESWYLLFSDIPANVIYMWNPLDDSVSIYLDHSGFHM